ncbi:hypothetical protein II941_02135 [bacterium]|nr:hypothetical protein [bacterium]
MYSTNKQTTLSMNKYLDLLATDDEFIKMLYQQTYDELTNSDFDQKLKVFADNLVIKHNQLNFENSNYHLHLDYVAPFQVFNIIVSNNTHNEVNKHFTNKYANNYLSLNSLVGNPSFFNKLIELAQP